MDCDILIVIQEVKTMSTTVSRLRAIRESRGWSRNVLSMKSKVPDAHIYMLETGRRTPHLKTAYKLANALELPIEDVFPKEEILHE